MTTLFSNSVSKVNTLIEVVNKMLIDGNLSEGDDLPSINEMSRQYGVSRDTVFKAYRELKQRGVIDATATKGYFVKGKLNHVLLLLDTYSSFKELLYTSLVDNLKDRTYKVDVLFHQYSERLFRTIIHDSLGRYSYYLVMNFRNDHFSPELGAIPEDKLLLLDFGNFDKGGLSYICQDFNQAFYDCLTEAKERLARYRKVVFFFPKKAMHPESAQGEVKRFCADSGMECEVVNREPRPEDIMPGAAYICITQLDLVKIVKVCNERGYQVGEDVGILVYNDMPVLEVIKKGISSVSIDFGRMGERAAEFIRSHERMQEYLPTRLILRNSL